MRKTLESKFKNWLKNKSIKEATNSKKRLDQSLSWIFLYKNIYHESLMKIDYGKLKDIKIY